MDRAEVIGLVREYKRVITPDFEGAKVYLYGSYSKGTDHKDSDIDVAVVVPTLNGDWLERSAYLWKKVDQVSLYIEPVLIAEDHPSPLYYDVLKTGVAV